MLHLLLHSQLISHSSSSLSPSKCTALALSVHKNISSHILPMHALSLGHQSRMISNSTSTSCAHLLFLQSSPSKRSLSSVKCTLSSCNLLIDDAMGYNKIERAVCLIVQHNLCADKERGEFKSGSEEGFLIAPIKSCKKLAAPPLTIAAFPSCNMEISDLVVCRTIVRSNDLDLVDNHWLCSRVGKY